MQPIKNHKGYFITKEGKVFSNVKRYQQPVKLREISQWKKNGYYAVSLTGKSYYLHRLLLETFVGECPKGMECLHKNGNRLDDRLENLQWGTRKQNQADRIIHGTDHRGMKHKKHKLSDTEVEWIKRLLKEGWQHERIASMFKVHKSTISGIATGRSWKHIK